MKKKFNSTTTKPISNIAKLRERRRLTQLELSQLTGVTEATIANWERGRKGLESLEKFIKLCEALECLPQELISYSEQNESNNLSEPEPYFSKIQDIEQSKAPILPAYKMKNIFQENLSENVALSRT